MAQEVSHLLLQEVQAVPVAEDSEMQQVEQILSVRDMQEATQLACMQAAELQEELVAAAVVAQVL
jgi:hypothetical protein